MKKYFIDITVLKEHQCIEVDVRNHETNIFMRLQSQIWTSKNVARGFKFSKTENELRGVIGYGTTPEELIDEIKSWFNTDIVEFTVTEK